MADQRKQVEAFKKVMAAWCQDPIKFRLLVSAVLFLVGYFLWCGPAADDLAAGRKKLERLSKRSKMADELKHFADQEELIRPRVSDTEDLGDWQDYVMSCVGDTGAKLRKLEPRKGMQRGKYRIVVMEVEADGSYEAVVKLIDRLEKGERIVRLDRLSIEKKVSSIGFRCVLMGLVRLRG